MAESSPFSPYSTLNNIKTLCKLGFKDRPLPVELLTAYFTPFAEVLWEIRYVNNTPNKSLISFTKPEYLILLRSQINSNGDFSYKEVCKINLINGKKVRRTNGNLQDFIQNKVNQILWGRASEFYINYPKHVLEHYISTIPDLLGLVLTAKIKEFELEASQS